GIKLLEDMVVKIDDAVYLAGRNDAHSRNRKPVADLLRDTPEDLPVILLDHRPTDLENVSRTGVDIQLSGHTHHGQLFPINGITNREYELSWGYIKKNRTHVFVTSGVQLWGPPVRTAGSSEILLLNVLFKEPPAEFRSPEKPGDSRRGRRLSISCLLPSAPDVEDDRLLPKRENGQNVMIQMRGPEDETKKGEGAFRRPSPGMACSLKGPCRAASLFNCPYRT
ncbi:MAG: hypothetical protein MUP28_03740, partial [Candidatus Aminicenantes bacterium]|nr:hypothetical protein [Candidatus Aminicenantes bacterium]